MIYMRKAGPKDLLAIMKIIEEARAFLAASESDQWQNAYPAVLDIEEDFANFINQFEWHNAETINLLNSVKPFGYKNFSSLFPLQPLYDGVLEGGLHDI